MLKSWKELPSYMQNGSVRPYYELLMKRQSSIRLKRVLDLFLALILTIVLSPVMAVIAIWIKLDSRGPVFFRQERITRYGKPYRIFKFRTMVVDADKKGPLVTAKRDGRITRAGKWLRGVRLDELPQLLNVITGDMSFVGARPEVKKYVDRYTDEMFATLLLPAGITSRASIAFKDEDRIIEMHTAKGKNVDDVYVEEVLPPKMQYNFRYLRSFGILEDIKIMIDTVVAVLK